MKLKISKNEHYIDIINECDFKEGSIAFTASCFLNKNIDGEFKDFSLSEENESIVKVLACSFESIELLKKIFNSQKVEGNLELWDEIKQLIKKATE